MVHPAEESRPSACDVKDNFNRYEPQHEFLPAYDEFLSASPFDDTQNASTDTSSSSGSNDQQAPDIL